MCVITRNNILDVQNTEPDIQNDPSYKRKKYVLRFVFKLKTFCIFVVPAFLTSSNSRLGKRNVYFTNFECYDNKASADNR